MMRVFFSILVLFSLTACSLVMAAPANNPSSPPTTNPQAQIDTYVAQTMDAQTQMAGAVQQTLAAMVTATPLMPSGTPLPALTLTTQVPLVSVSVETNCRTGPGTVFPALGVLRVGQSAEVVGVSIYKDTWIIKLPSNPAVTCWLWGQYATVVGDTSGLPAITPPPTPTPQFTSTPAASFILEYSDSQVCPAVRISYNLKITNNGSVSWNSNSVTLTDLDNQEQNTTTRDLFPQAVGCVENPGVSGILKPGDVGYTYSSLTLINPHHNVKAVVRLCSEDGMMGTCLDRTITFTP